MGITTTPVHYATPDEAAAAHVMGWNLRCNLCGTYGAEWIPEERPGWGCLALCPTHEADLASVHREYRAALSELRTINFEQPTRPSPRYAYDD